MPVNGSIINYDYDPTYKLVKSISATENGVLNKNNTEYLKGLEIEHSDKTSESDSQASIFTYEYDSFGRIIKILMDGSLYCEIEYDNANHNKKTITYSCGEIEKMETDKNDTEVNVNRTDAVSGECKEQIEMKLDSYGRMKHLRDNSDGERKYVFEYDDCGRVKKVGVEDKGNNDCFYTIYNKRTFNNNNQITEVSFEHDTDDLVGEEKYLDRISFEYEEEYEGKLISAEHKQETNLGKETQTFDELERVFTTNKLGGTLGKIYSYHENGDEGEDITCNLVACEEYVSNNVFEEGFVYQYDALNRLTEVRKFNIIIKKYTYDGLGRLSREDNADLQKTYIFVYDNSGNVLTKNEYEYTIGSLDGSTPINTYSYTYNKNMLVSVVKNNNTSTMLTCTYPTVGDTSKTQIGNPLTYCGKSLSWSKVHQLSSFNGLTFGYDYAGIRTRKGNIKFAYEQDKLIVQRNADGSKIIFYYGLDGLTGFNYNNQTYVYKKNIFGDIIGIYRVTATINEDDEISYSSTLVAKYVYDAWGNHKVLDANSGVGNNSADFIGNINLFRYRGYYFDVETDLYYLQSRYYDPSVGRFISMDKVEYIDSESINGVNLFVYCGNDPVNNSDPKGNFFVVALVASIVIGAAVSAVSSAVSQLAENGKVDGRIILVNAIAGGLSGALAATGIGVGASVALNAAIGAGTYYMEQKIKNDKVYFGELFFNAGIGALAGKIGGAGGRFKELDDAWRVAGKKMAKMSVKDNKKYAAKQIAKLTAERSQLKKDVTMTILQSNIGTVFSKNITGLISEMFGV